MLLLQRIFNVIVGKKRVYRYFYKLSSATTPMTKVQNKAPNYAKKLQAVAEQVKITKDCSIGNFIFWPPFISK